MTTIEEFASLVINIDATSAKTAKVAQDDLAASSVKLEAATGNLKKATDSMGSSARSTTADLRQHEQDLKSVAKSTDELAEKRERLKRLSDSGALFGSSLAESTKALDAQEKAVSRLTDSHGKSSAAMREAGVMAGEFLRGNYTRLEGSTITLLNRTGTLTDIFKFLGARGGVVGGTIAVVAGLGAAIYESTSIMSQYQRALLASGNYAGSTAAELKTTADAVGRHTGRMRDAQEAVLELAAGGRVAAGDLQTVSTAVVNFSEITGKSVKEAVKEISKIGDDPVKGVLELDKSMHFLTGTMYDNIKSLDDAGKHSDAVALAYRAFGDDVEAKSKKMVESMGSVELAMRKIRNFWGAVFTASSWAPPTAQENLERDFEEAKRRYETLKKYRDDGATQIRDPSQGFAMVDANSAVENARKIAFDLQEKIRASQAAATGAGLDNDVTKDGTAAREAIDKRFERIDKTAAKQRELNKLTEEYQKIWLQDQKEDRLNDPRMKGVTPNADGTFSGGVYDRLKKEIEDRYKDRGAGAIGHAEESQQAKAFAADMQRFADSFKNSMREIDRTRQAGNISSTEYYARAHELLDRERSDQDRAIAAEIARLQRRAVAGKDAIANQTRINELRAQQAKIDADAASQEKQFAQEREQALKKINTAVDAYTVTLNKRIDAEKNAIALRVASIGMGQREYSELQQLNALELQYTREKELLDVQIAKGGDAAIIAARNLEALRAKTDELRNTTLRGFADMKAAQDDWTNGARKALQDYADRAKDTAGMADQALAGAFTKAEDALVSFAQTGKLNFKSFAVSVLADIERILVRMELLKAAEWALGLMGGGMQTASAGAMPTENFKITPSANGNVFQHGAPVTAFASGGAFTNTVATSPTLAPMALFGEAGPEAIMPLTRGGDGKLGVKAAGGGGGGVVNQVSVSVTIDGNGNAQSSSRADSEAGGKQLGDMVAGVVQQELVRQSRQGGLIWRQLNGRG